MVKEKRLLIAVSLIAFVLFWIINTMNPNPGQSSGNGNPAILFILVLVLLFFYFVILWLRIFQSYSIKYSALLIGMLVIAVHWTIGLFYQRRSFYQYKQILAGAFKENFGFVDWEYINQIASIMSYHVNNQYFNVNTFFMYLTLSIFAALSTLLVQKFMTKT